MKKTRLEQMSLLWSFSHVASSAPLHPLSYRTNVVYEGDKTFQISSPAHICCNKNHQKNKKESFHVNSHQQMRRFPQFFSLFSPLSRTIVRWQVIIKQTHIMCDNDWSVAWAWKMDFHVTPTSIHHFDEQWHGFHVFFWFVDFAAEFFDVEDFLRCV